MKKIILGIAAVAVLVTGAMFAIGQKAGRTDGRGFSHGHRGGEIPLRGLNLTDEQKAKVKEIMDASRVSVEPLREQARTNHEKIAGLGTDGKFDQAQVEAIAAEQGNLTAKLIVEKEKAKAQIFAILTDEQKAKATEMNSKFQEKTGGERHHRPEKTDSEF